MENTESLKFNNGVKDGLPIGLGYFPVAFAFGVKASILGVPLIITLLISMTNLTSAGQLAGLDVIATAGSIIEVILTQLVINSRYFLMSITLSQKTDESFNLKNRLFCSAFITDEIFAVASSKNTFNAKYFYGLALLPYIFWALGTLFGAVCGNILPAFITSALGIALYAMFIAIIIPDTMKNIGVLFAVLLSAGISSALYYLPFINVSGGISIILTALFSAGVIAFIFPQSKENEQ